MAIRLGIGIGTQDSAGGGGGPPPAFTETRSIVFDGVDDFLDGGAAAPLSGTGNFSVSVWMKTSVTIPFGTAIAMTDATTTLDFAVGIGANLLGMMRDSGGTNNVITSTLGPYPNGVWHCAVLTWDGSDLVLDINGGAERLVQAVTATRGGGGALLKLGAYGSVPGVYQFNGNVDEPAYWSSALSAAQCIELFNSGTPTDLSTHSAAADLVSWWRMGDWPGDSTDSTNPAARVYDAIGSVDLTPVNMTAADIVLDVPPSPPFTNDKSFQVDGVDEEAVGPDHTDFDFDIGSPFTISAWVRDDIQGNHTIAGKRFGAPSYRGYWFGIYNGLPWVQFFSNYAAFLYGDMRGSKWIASGRWVHVCFTWDGNATGDMNGLKFYIDGAQDVSTVINYNGLASSTFDAAGTAFRLGALADPGYFLQGGLDEVSVFSRELSAFDVSNLYNNGDPDRLTGLLDLVSWWRMGDAPGDSTDPAGTPLLVDVVSGHNLTPQNTEAADLVSKVPNGWWNLVSMEFDGISSYTRIGPVASPPTLDSADPWTISAWFKSSGATVQCIFGRADSFSPYRGWTLTLEPGGELFMSLIHDSVAADWLGSITNNSGWNDGAWHHVSASYDGSRTAAGITMVVDGAAQAMTHVTDSLGAGTIIVPWIEMTAGLRNSTGCVSILFGGELEELSLWDRVLTTLEAQELYNSGTPTDIAAHSAYANILAWWRMGDNTEDSAENFNGKIVDVTGNGYDMQPINTAETYLKPDVP